MRPRRHHLYDFSEFDVDDFKGPASDSLSGKLLGGSVLPCLLVLDSLYAIINLQEFECIYMRQRLHVEGKEAVFWGICEQLIAAFFHHFHYIWTCSEKLWQYSELLKILSFGGAVIAFGLTILFKFSFI